MKMAVFSVVVPCSLVEVYQRFRGPCCLHNQSDEYFLVFEIFSFKFCVHFLTPPCVLHIPSISPAVTRPLIILQ
jgi:hypothetical protein